MAAKIEVLFHDVAFIDSKRICQVQVQYRDPDQDEFWWQDFESIPAAIAHLDQYGYVYESNAVVIRYGKVAEFYAD